MFNYSCAYSDIHVLQKKKICIPSEAYKEDQSNGSNLYDKT